MSRKGAELKIRRTLPLAEVRWDSLVPILLRRESADRPSAERSLERFHREVRFPFNPRWPVNGELLPDENAIARALAELYSTDVMTLVSTRALRCGPLSFSYEHRVDIEPTLRADSLERGKCASYLSLRFLGATMTIGTPLERWLLLVSIAALGAVFYAIVFGLFLYGTAVMLLFTVEPVAVGRAAARDLRIGLALLCYLVGFGALAGNVVRDGIRAWRKLCDCSARAFAWLRRRIASGSA